jgi:hypothetical protein
VYLIPLIPLIPNSPTHTDLLPCDFTRLVPAVPLAIVFNPVVELFVFPIACSICPVRVYSNSPSSTRPRVYSTGRALTPPPPFPPGILGFRPSSCQLCAPCRSLYCNNLVNTRQPPPSRFFPSIRLHPCDVEFWLFWISSPTVCLSLPFVLWLPFQCFLPIPLHSPPFVP